MPEARRFKLRVFPEILSVCQLPPGDAIPPWATSHAVFSVTRTPDELTVVAPEECVPGAVKSQRGFRALQVAGPLDFSEVGVLASLAAPLAKVGISIFAISTYHTDYILVRQADLERATSALGRAGHEVVEGES